jgi:hypothetical protein
MQGNKESVFVGKILVHRSEADAAVSAIRLVVIEEAPPRLRSFTAASSMACPVQDALPVAYITCDLPGGRDYAAARLIP